jgi:hypothetical protein
MRAERYLKGDSQMSRNTVTQKHVDSIMQNTEFDVKTIFGKVTVVTAKLPNGFTLVESSGCVDPANYNQSLGAEICKKRIEDQIWAFEGYVLQQDLYRMIE